MIVRSRINIVATEEVEDGWVILLDENEGFLGMAAAQEIGPTMDRIGPRNVRGLAFSLASFDALLEGIRRLGPGGHHA